MGGDGSLSEPDRGREGGPTSRARAMLFDEPLGLDDEDRPREELPGGCELVYRGQASVLFSERGHGKSTVSTLIGVAAAARGERVYYWDRENGRQLTGRRVASILDAYPEWPDVRERAGGRFVYREYPRLDPSATPAEMGEAFEGFGLVIYDSLREAIAQLGGDPNAEESISKFVGLCVTPILRQGGAVLISDNVGHEATHRPKGSASKLDAIPSAFKVVAVEQFSEIKLGGVEITCTRSRLGDMDRVWRMGVGAGTWELPQSRTENPDHKAAREVANHKALLKRTCLRALEESSPLGAKALAALAHEAGLHKRYAVVLEWLKDLVEEGALAHSEEGYGLPSKGVPAGGSRGGFPPAMYSRHSSSETPSLEEGSNGSLSHPSSQSEKGAPPAVPDRDAEPGSPARLAYLRQRREHFEAEVRNGAATVAQLSDVELAELFPGAVVERLAPAPHDPNRRLSDQVRRPWLAADHGAEVAEAERFARSWARITRGESVEPATPSDPVELAAEVIACALTGAPHVVGQWWPSRPIRNGLKVYGIDDEGVIAEALDRLGVEVRRQGATGAGWRLAHVPGAMA